MSFMSFRSKVPHFFLPGIVYGHSLTRFQQSWYFFSENREKKIPLYFLVFFFPRKSLHAIHSTFWRSLNKKWGGKLKNVIFTSIWRSIFFSLYFFFPGKSLNFTHSLVSNPCTFFFRHRKKKYTIFTHSLDFGRYCHKSKLCQETKKNTVPLQGGLIFYKQFFCPFFLCIFFFLEKV